MPHLRLRSVLVSKQEQPAQGAAPLAKCLFALAVCLTPSPGFADWPAYQSNVQRTGVGSDPLPSASLQPLWFWSSPEPPRPAWAGPAMWDAYANIRDLPAMRDYDSAPHAVVAGDRVCFGSTTDDTVRCLDAVTGEMLWRYTTDGPVRIAPMWHDGRVYFGSDDGAAYCLNGETGKLIWRVAAAPVDADAAPPVLNNGRIISRHPVRTGVIVDGGIAYFGAALLPWESGYLCAVVADSGQLSDAGTYRVTLDGKTLEGPPAVTQRQLVFPQGRVAPQLFQREDGKDLGSLKKSSGGSIVVVNRGQVMHGPGVDSRRGGIAASNVETREQVATFGRGNAMVVDRETVYMLADGALSAASLVTRKPLWKVQVDASLALIKSGDALLLGGVDIVEAYDAATGTRQWSHHVPGRAKGLAASGGRLFVSTDEGFVIAFASDVEQPVELPRAPSPVDVKASADDADQNLIALRPLLRTPEDPSMLGRWVFRRDQTKGRVVANQLKGSASQLDGAFRWSRSAGGVEEAVEWDGSGSAIVAADHRQAILPKEAMTIEAIVRIDTAMTWGGIANVIQDNGAFERGWLLGFRDDKFCFAVCGKEGKKPGTLTYLTAPKPFPLRQWRHVAGVYDGATMRLYVDGVEAAQSSDQSGEIWYPPKTHFEFGAYHDDNEYYRLKGALREVRLYKRALGGEEVRQRGQAAAEIIGQLHDGREEAKANIFRVSPSVRFVDLETAEVTWETKTSGPSQLQWWMEGAGPGAKLHVTKSGSTSTAHRVRIGPLRSNRRYQYRVVTAPSSSGQETVDSGAGSANGEVMSEEFTCDTFFNYSPAHIRVKNQSEVLPNWFRRQAMSQGLCLVYGASLAAEAEQLASQYRVLVVDDDKAAIAKLRSEWVEQGVYGSCLSARALESIDVLPGDWANLIVATNTSPKVRQELARQLKPGGGVMLQAYSQEPASDQPEQDELVRSPDGRQWRRRLRAAWAGVSDWSHLYGDPNNAAYTGERLGDADSSDDLIVQWIGRPGPRYQSDRSGRKPSPLATAGRLYLQGWRRIVALDSHNGEPLWSLELPRFERFNVPRDCGNWCADEHNVYAAIEDRVWQIDAATGKVVAQLPLPTPENETKSDGMEDRSWGYSARVGERLLGTSVRREAVWTNFWGGAGSGWYDAKSGEVTAHVAGDTLFAYDIQAGTADKPRIAWTYDGLVLHATVTADKSRVWFLECRDKETLQAEGRRLQGKAVWDDMYLVCLDVQSGVKRWERKLEADPGEVMASLAHSNGRLVLMTSGNNKFHVRAFRDDGKPVESDLPNAVQAKDPFTIWTQHVPWGRDNHGGHMSRPAIVDDAVYVRPFSFSLNSGKLSPQRMPVGGCGTYACTDQALFFRQSTVTVWNRETAETTTWRRLRPDCWLSTIPADGMLLSPEGGGGCSCGTWLETSLGFKPKTRRD